MREFAGGGDFGLRGQGLAERLRLVGGDGRLSVGDWGLGDGHTRLGEPVQRGRAVGGREVAHWWHVGGQRRLGGAVGAEPGGRERRLVLAGAGHLERRRGPGQRVRDPPIPLRRLVVVAGLDEVGLDRAVVGARLGAAGVRGVVAAVGGRALHQVAHHLVLYHSVGQRLVWHRRGAPA